MEMATAIFMWILSAVILCVRIIYGGNLILLFVIFIVSAVALSVLLMTPLGYEFKEEELVIINKKPFSDRHIPYSSMIKCDTIGSFMISKSDIDAVEVLITYKTEGNNRKKTVCCHPKKVDKFIEMLHESCPNMEYDPD